jgi:hypothetical protein
MITLCITHLVLFRSPSAISNIFEKSGRCPFWHDNLGSTTRAPPERPGVLGFVPRLSFLLNDTSLKFYLHQGASLHFQLRRESNAIKSASRVQDSNAGVCAQDNSEKRDTLQLGRISAKAAGE